MDPKTTALVLIEYQNDFVKPGGANYEGVKGVMESTNMLANTLATVDEARERGATIMHAAISFAEGYPEIPANPYGILAGIVAGQAFRKGTWGAEIIEELTPQPGDIVIEGKRGLDCFASTNLDFVLRQRGVTDVVLAGFLTNCCVESTMRSAYERGFRVVTLTDCTAALSEEEQRVATTKDFALFSRPMTHEAFLAELGGAAA
ncbi:cysteine hydrolase [Rhodomicrobium vannielii ATCC 17100]|uniref:cysteine hydrolase family protein n=1 Tax=Rhodomicrobium vannielii TaxID=1069 RepID=UPI001917F1C5|nr:isochorismatase family cysteine hydrolase [Rhodomicrobium vannielii]MBJ7534535.1 cysteine hydrolase [Rhodomicrobium vannielii ATCC 17100]